MSTDAKWVIGVLLGLQTLFVGSTFGTSLVTLAYASIALMMLFPRLSRSGSSRSGSTVDEPDDAARISKLRWILRACFFVFVAAAATVWRVPTYVGEGVNPMVVGVDVVAHTCLFAGWVVWFLQPRDGNVSLLPLGMLVVLLCVAAGGASHSLAGQTTVALCACIGFLFASQAILSGNRTARQFVFAGGDEGVGKFRVATLLSLLTLSAILMATSAIAKATSDALPSIQSMLHAKLKDSLDAVVTEKSIGGTRYVRGSRLGSIRQHILGDPNEIALRLYCDSSPGYLRGHAFDLYEDKRWYMASRLQLPSKSATRETQDREVGPSGAGTATLTRQLRRTLKRFQIHLDSEPAMVTVETHNDPIKGPFVFTPLGTRWLEASSRQLTVSHNGIVQTGVDATVPYVAGVAAKAPRDPLTSERRNVLLWVPDEIRQVADPLVARLCRDQNGARGKADSISRYFQENYKYSLGDIANARRVEPVVHFLTSEHPAHCEYFASATVMLLRSCGVPARYVTGYVAAEVSDDTEYWIARNRDAHAWAEAYDDLTQRWFPVESTPGRAYQTLDFGNADLDAGGLFGADRDTDDSGDRSWLGQIWGWLFSMRATDPLIFIFRIAQLPLFCLLAFLLWRRFGRSSSDHAQPIDVQSLRMLRQVDRRVRKHSLVRGGHETLHQFAGRIEGSILAEQIQEKEQALAEAAAWYRQYAEARYRGRLPNPFQ